MSAVHSFGTGYQTTTAEALDEGGWLWSREPGRDNDAGMPDVPQLDPDTAALELDAVRFVLPHRHDRGRVTWRTTGAVPFAEVVRTRPESVEARDGVRRLVTAASAWHLAVAGSAPYRMAGAPPGLLRMRAWMVDGTGPRASGPFHARLRSAMGTDRWDRLHEAVESLLLDASERRQPVHGWLSLGNVLLTPSEEGVPVLEVLTGPDVASGLPEYDLGCLVGEIEEFSALAAAAGGSGVAHLHLGTIARSCYRGPLRPEMVSRAVAVRVALHARDFASFVGWYDDLERYIPIIADLLDSAAGA